MKKKIEELRKSNLQVYKGYAIYKMISSVTKRRLWVAMPIDNSFITSANKLDYLKEIIDEKIENPNPTKGEEQR